jgi:hypothetical protein
MGPAPNDKDDSPEGWLYYRKLIVQQLSDLRADMDKQQKSITQIREEDLATFRVELALLKLKNSIWSVLLGGLSGLLVAIATVLLHH